MYRNKLGVHADSLVGIIHSKPNTRATLGSSDIFLHVMTSSKRWNDYSSDNEYAEKILPPGILSRSIGGVDSGAHDALHNVRACLSYQYWSVRHRSFEQGFHIGSRCPRPKRVLMPMEACLAIMATFNATRSAQERQWVFTVPFPFHNELWWLRGAKIEPYTLRPALMRKKDGIAIAAFELTPNFCSGIFRYLLRAAPSCRNEIWTNVLGRWVEIMKAEKQRQFGWLRWRHRAYRSIQSWLDLPIVLWLKPAKKGLARQYAPVISLFEALQS